MVLTPLQVSEDGFKCANNRNIDFLKPPANPDKRLPQLSTGTYQRQRYHSPVHGQIPHVLMLRVHHIPQGEQVVALRSAEIHRRPPAVP